PEQLSAAGPVSAGTSPDGTGAPTPIKESDTAGTELRRKMASRLGDLSRMYSLAKQKKLDT
ncbi:MAG: hypothetical protein N3E40_03095, partial [Dehalococcoidia bacterium]|nr:hypothetical protein [Dehalococcoidia bacterium]